MALRIAITVGPLTRGRTRLATPPAADPIPPTPGRPVIDVLLLLISGTALASVAIADDTAQLRAHIEHA